MSSHSERPWKAPTTLSGRKWEGGAIQMEPVVVAVMSGAGQLYTQQIKEKSRYSFNIYLIKLKA